MWDTTAALSAYTPFVNQLAALVVDFGGGVAPEWRFSSLRNRTIRWRDPASVLGQVHKVPYPVRNLTRITVQGSTNVPHEWLRLTIDPRASDVFTAENVVYCATDLCSL